MKLRKRSALTVFVLLLICMGTAARAAGNRKTAAAFVLYVEDNTLNPLSAAFGSTAGGCFDARQGFRVVSDADTETADFNGAARYSLTWYRLGEDGEIASAVPKGTVLQEGLYLYSAELILQEDSENGPVTEGAVYASEAAAGEGTPVSFAILPEGAADPVYQMARVKRIQNGSGVQSILRLQRAVKIENSGISLPLTFSGEEVFVPQTTENVPVDELQLAFQVSGGKKPYKYEKTDGPAWLKVDAQTGTVSGTPGSADIGLQKPLSVHITDAAGKSIDASIFVRDVLCGRRNEVLLQEISVPVDSAFLEQLKRGGVFYENNLPKLQDASVKLSSGTVRNREDGPLRLVFSELNRLEGSRKTRVTSRTTLYDGEYVLTLQAMVTDVYASYIRLGAGDYQNPSRAEKDQIVLRLTLNGQDYCRCRSSYVYDSGYYGGFASFDIHFTVDTAPAGSGPALSHTLVQLHRNETLQLKAYGLSGNLSWTSSNHRYVSAENGLLQAKVPGNETVTVSDGTTTLKCQVKILLDDLYPVILERGVYLDGGSGFRSEGGKVTVTANPAGTGKYFLRWECEGAALDDPFSKTVSFAMPKGEVRLRAVYASRFPAHIHNKILAGAKEPDCEHGGNSSFRFCECGLYFRGEGASQPMTDLSEVILEPLGHTYMNGSCIRCGAAEPVQPSTAETQESREPGSEASSEEGSTEECSETGETSGSDEPDQPKLPKTPGERFKAGMIGLGSAAAVLAAVALAAAVALKSKKGKKES